jgi:hypothetical protein
MPGWPQIDSCQAMAAKAPQPAATTSPVWLGAHFRQEGMIRMSDLESCGSQVQSAVWVARVHVPIPWPEGLRCLNDGGPFPCDGYRWAFHVLKCAGWHEHQIDALDMRTGPWS